MATVRVVKTADTLTQRDWLAYLRAARDVPGLGEDALTQEHALRAVQIAARAGWLDCGGLDPAAVEDWPLSVDLRALARQVNAVYEEATRPDPKASSPPPPRGRTRRRS